jgi:DNA replication and repair protein RecF
MIIKTLSVTNFRNHINTTVELSSGINVLMGNNAQGKTNLLEAIYLTCVGRGWRTNRDREMINFEKDDARVTAVTQKKFGDVRVDIMLSRTAKKAIKINHIPVAKMGELMGQVNCVFFSPDELRLVKEAPADRRRFLDIDISQTDKVYFYALMRYNKILMQRNALLKSGVDVNRGLDIWDGQLARAGSVIVHKRLQFLDKLREGVTKVHNYLTEEKEQILLSYINITSLGTEEQIANLDEQQIEAIILRQLLDARQKDIRLRTTTVGPHRDDIKIQINEKDVRNFASQGQQRTVALSIKLAELAVFREITGEAPILLLDDVLSELDEKRQQRLLKCLKTCQCIITTTSFNENAVVRLFSVHDGAITLL